MSHKKQLFKSFNAISSFIEESIEEGALHKLQVTNVIIPSYKVRDAVHYLRNQYPDRSSSIILPDINYYQCIDSFGKKVSPLREFLSRSVPCYDGKKNLKLIMSEIRELRNILGVDVNSYTHELYLEFSRDFNWNPGDFGDANSCYFGGKSGARKMILDNGGFVMKFYKDQDREKKLGRCWGVALEKREALVIWNGYAKLSITNRDVNPYHWMYARALAETFGLYIKQILLRNNEHATGTLHINNGGIAITTEPSDIKYIDFRWEDKRVLKCRYCPFITINEDEIVHSVNGISACKSCAEREFEICNFDLNLYTKDLMATGPNGLRYLRENLYLVPEFVCLHNGTFALKAEAKELKRAHGDSIWVDKDSLAFICKECGSFIPNILGTVTDNVCATCKDMAAAAQRIRAEIRGFYRIMLV